MTYKEILDGPEEQNSDTATHLLLFLHGYGADGNDLFSLGAEFADVLPDGTKVISPNAPFPCEMNPGGYQWFGISGSLSPDALASGVKHAGSILQNYLDAVLADHNLTEDKLIIVGFSQGTMTALYTALRRARPVAGIVGYSGMFIHDPDQTDEITAKPPLLLVHGAMDMVVAPMYLSMAEGALRHLGCEVETHLRPGLPHGIDPEGIRLAKEFIHDKWA